MKIFAYTTVFGLLGSLLSLNTPVQAENCTPIPLVGGQGNQVIKTVAQPTIPGPFGIKITRNNWNTDWAVPRTGDRFQRFEVTIISSDGGTFDIRIHLKYSDQTADEFYNQQGRKLVSAEPLKIEGTSRPDDEPYQVNLFVNGIESLGKNYTASAVGCY